MDRQEDTPNYTIYFLLATIAFAYALMVMGTFVTSTGSGLACPDWPKCYGSFVPPREVQIWFEWGHRLLGAATGFLLMATTYTIYKNYSTLPKTLISIVLILLVTAVLLGGLIVKTEAPLLETLSHTVIISTHLIIATVVLSLLVFLYKLLTEPKLVPGSNRYGLLFTLAYIQIIIGILVRYSGATLACPDVPLCMGELIPSFDTLQVTLHFIHRLFALVVFTTALVILVKAFMEGSGVQGFVITFVLISLQAIWGISIVVSKMFLPFIILHGATGFLILAWLAYNAMPYLFRKCDRADIS